MRKLRIASSLIAVSLAATTLLTACNQSSGNENATTTSDNASAATTTPAATEGNSGGDTTTAENSTASALAYDAGTVLRMATGYNSKDTGLSFDAEIAGEGIQLADGNTYHTGDLKPTWVEVQNRLNITIEDKYQGNNSTNEFEYWQAQLDQIGRASCRERVSVPV